MRYPQVFPMTAELIPAARVGDDLLVEAPEWWAEHEVGTGDRPRPGTRVEIRATGQVGVVSLYDGQWRSHTFPVRVVTSPRTVVQQLFCVRDVKVLPNGAPGSTWLINSAEGLPQDHRKRPEYRPTLKAGGGHDRFAAAVG